MEVQMPLLTGAIFILMGALFASCGYRLMRSMIRIQTAVIFAAAAMQIGAGLEWSPFITFGAAIGAGILGYFLGDFMYYVNIFLMGAIFGGFLTGLLALMVGSEIGLAGIIIGAVVGAVLGAVLALVFERPAGILISSLMGGALIVLGGCLAITGKDLRHLDGWIYWVAIAALGVIAVLGCVFQGKTTQNLPPRQQGAGEGARPMRSR